MWRMLILAVALVVGCGQPAAVPDPTRSATVVPTDSVRVNGQLNAQSGPFALQDGGYVITWTVTGKPPDNGCFGALELQSPSDPQFRASIVNGIDAKLTPIGTTQWYRVKAGTYFVNSDTNCPSWSVTFTKS